LARVSCLDRLSCRLRRTALGLALAGLAGVAAAASAPEKDELALGFIKLTDCAPLVVAKELGYFEDEGLFVTLEAQANWKILLDRVISGELDGAHMLAGQPLGATLGVGTQAHLVTANVLDRSGNACTVSNAIWAKMQAAEPALAAKPSPRPVKAGALRSAVEEAQLSGDPLRLGMVFPLSSHNYELRYWLAAGGIVPGFYDGDPNGTRDAEVLISVTPPPQMPATLAQGTLSGFCVGEPWNGAAVAQGIGVAVVTNADIRGGMAEKVFGVTAAWSARHPETHVRLVKALLRAGHWLDAGAANRSRAVELLSRPEYVGADPAILANGLTGVFEYERGERRPHPSFNVFFRDHTTYPWTSDAVWFLTQMRRWGQVEGPRDDAWYATTARSVFKPEIWREAARRLVAEGRLAPTDVPETDGYRPASDAFIDGVRFDGRQPNAYLRSFAIGRKD
jgi:nitrate/nitrite transport system substrate-binding protein